MAKKNRIVKETCALSLNDLFPRFVASQIAKGVSEKTIKTYQGHFHCIALHLDTLKPIEELTKEDLENLIIAFRKKGLSPNSISSYSRVLRTMLNWCREMGYTNLQMPPMKDKETVKETYSDEELKRLLQKPDRNCDFCEYRNWAIVSFLLNSGCRASTLRNIQNRDIDLFARQVRFRHTKTGKVQVIPLCSVMVNILRDYMMVRRGEGADYLFCNEYGEMLTENALREAVYRYNRKRGVEKTSLHAFRHTFARKYLVDCGGDAFTLQKLLGHSTLQMTKHYCAIYDADIAKNYDALSPLAQICAPKERIQRN